MSDPNQPPYQDRPPGPPPPGAPPGQWGAPPGQSPPPPGQWGQAPGQWPGGQFAQPAAQPYMGGYHGPDWVPELGVRIGSAGARVGAKAIDILIVIVANVIFQLVAMALFAQDILSTSQSEEFSTAWGYNSGTSVAFAAALGLLTLGFDFLYNVVLTAQFGGTPGKLMLGLRVIHNDGREITFAGAFMRWTPILALAVLGLIPLVFLAILVMLLRLGLLIANLALVLSDDRRQSVFDRVGRTYVIAAR